MKVAKESRTDAGCTRVTSAAMQLIFEQIRAGGDRNFGYLLGDRDTGQGVLIDPSYSPEATHGHPDHTNGNARAAELTAAPVAAFADSSLVSPDLGLGDEQELEVGGLRLQFLARPAGPLMTSRAMIMAAAGGLGLVEARLEPDRAKSDSRTSGLKQRVREPRGCAPTPFT
jgi:hypothetical protein